MCPLFYHECAEAKRKCAEAERKITWKIFNVYIFTTLFIFDLHTLSRIWLYRNYALFREALLAKIWWGEARKHFKGPGSGDSGESGDSSDSGDYGESGDSGDSGDCGDSGDSCDCGETGDSADFGESDDALMMHWECHN